MTIQQRLAEQGITKYRLSKDSGVPYTTINDICSGKARVEKCSADTLYRIAKALDVPMETLIESAMEGGGDMEHRPSFELYKSNVCHRVKDIGDLDFIIRTLETDEIRRLYEKQWYPECLYLLAMVDYLSRENSLPLCTNYNDLRAQRLKETIYPASVVVASYAAKDDRMRQESWSAAIPEFRRFNIVESEVRNVY